jgi:hypothetical protein
MRRTRRWFRRLAAAAATVAIGAMLGYLVPTIIADYSPKPELQAQSVVAESPVARTFIRAFVNDDQATLDSLGVAAPVKLRATSFKTDLASIDQPVHLGSYIGGGFTLHSYAAHAKDAQGADVMLSWRVVTGGGGQIALVDPPSPGNVQP